MPFEWDEENTLNFIKIYRKFPCLWNPYHRSYYDCSAKNTAFERVVRELNTPGATLAECLHQVKVIRKKYRVEQLHTIHGLKTGELYKSNIPWYDTMAEMLAQVINEEEKRGPLKLATTSSSAICVNTLAIDDNLIAPDHWKSSVDQPIFHDELNRPNVKMKEFEFIPCSNVFQEFENRGNNYETSHRQKKKTANHKRREGFSFRPDYAKYPGEKRPLKKGDNNSMKTTNWPKYVRCPNTSNELQGNIGTINKQGCRRNVEGMRSNRENASTDVPVPHFRNFEIAPKRRTFPENNLDYHEKKVVDGMPTLLNCPSCGWEDFEMNKNDNVQPSTRDANELLLRRGIKFAPTYPQWNGTSLKSGLAENYDSKARMKMVPCPSYPFAASKAHSRSMEGEQRVIDYAPYPDVLENDPSQSATNLSTNLLPTGTVCSNVSTEMNKTADKRPTELEIIRMAGKPKDSETFSASNVEYCAGKLSKHDFKNAPVPRNVEFAPKIAARFENGLFEGYSHFKINLLLSSSEDSNASSAKESKKCSTDAQMERETSQKGMSTMRSTVCMQETQTFGTGELPCNTRNRMTDEEIETAEGRSKEVHVISNENLEKRFSQFAESSTARSAEIHRDVKENKTTSIHKEHIVKAVEEEEIQNPCTKDSCSAKRRPSATRVLLQFVEKLLDLEEQYQIFSSEHVDGPINASVDANLISRALSEENPNSPLERSTNRDTRESHLSDVPSSSTIISGRFSGPATLRVPGTERPRILCGPCREAEERALRRNSAPIRQASFNEAEPETSYERVTHVEALQSSQPAAVLSPTLPREISQRNGDNSSSSRASGSRISHDNSRLAVMGSTRRTSISSFRREIPVEKATLSDNCSTCLKADKVDKGDDLSRGQLIKTFLEILKCILPTDKSSESKEGDCGCCSKHESSEVIDRVVTCAANLLKIDANRSVPLAYVNRLVKKLCKNELMEAARYTQTIPKYDTNSESSSQRRAEKFPRNSHQENLNVEENAVFRSSPDEDEDPARSEQLDELEIGDVFRTLDDSSVYHPIIPPHSPTRERERSEDIDLLGTNRRLVERDRRPRVYLEEVEQTRAQDYSNQREAGRMSSIEEHLQ